MRINFFVENVSFHLNDKRILKNWIKHICLTEDKVIGNLNFIFTSNEQILNINVQYLNHDYFTDIITFNYNMENVINGDIYISIEKVKENSLFYDCTFLEELFRVIIHGVFHLSGYDDKTKRQQKIMREKENLALFTLNKDFFSI